MAGLKELSPKSEMKETTLKEHIMSGMSVINRLAAARSGQGTDHRVRDVCEVTCAISTHGL